MGFVRKLYHAGLRKYVRRSVSVERVEEQFLGRLGYPLNIESPKTFNEKLQWIKFHHITPLMNFVSDKLLLREYLEKKSQGQLLPSLYGVWDAPSQVEWDALPDQFVLKTNHDSGSVWVVKDKNNFDKKRFARKAKRSLRKLYGYDKGELNYLDITPQLFAEELLHDDHEDLLDYKFFCFHGEPQYIQVDFDRFTDHTRTFYDLEWNNLHFTTGCPLSQKTVERPACLDKMVSLARQLTDQFLFCRVDMYVCGETIKLGELTFFHGSGMERFSPSEWDRALGDKLQLPFER